MARRGKKASEEEWLDHILHIAGGYTRRTYGNWEVQYRLQYITHSYETWLALSGFEVRQGKSLDDLSKEKACLAEQQSFWQEIVRLKNRPLDFLKRVLAHDGPILFFADDHFCTMAKRLIQAREGLQNIDEFFAMLKFIDKKSKFLWADPVYATGAQTYLDPLIRLWHRRGQWRRPLEEWRPRSHNRERQFSSILRHLMADYDVPAFMDTVWLRNDSGSARLRDAWVHVGRGKNIRTAKRLPMPLSKKAAHMLLTAPEELSFEHAFKWAHLKALGMRPRACGAMLASRWGGGFEDLEFWNSFSRFLVKNPMIAPDRIGPIIDFIYAQKFEGPVILIDGEDILRDDPPHPGFSMRGRTGAALLEQVEDWHRELGRTEASRGKGRSAMDKTYCKSGWKTYGSIEKLNADEKLNWTFMEILAESDLHNEGRTMRHCIYTYHSHVVTGRCSIWSLRTVRIGGPHDGKVKRHLTIEVSSQGRINEARGFGNELPTGRAARLLKEWAALNRMSVPDYIFN